MHDSRKCMNYFLIDGFLPILAFHYINNAIASAVVNRKHVHFNSAARSVDNLFGFDFESNFLENPRNTLL